MTSAIMRLALAGLLAVAIHATVQGAWAQTQQSGPGWIIDPAAQCGTSNPFAGGNESISWSGDCLRGRLHGPGVLIWFEDGVETERDEGTFRNGELDGAAVIKLADQTTIFGNYRDGVRHGEFMIVRPDGSYLQSVYSDGTLIGQKSLDRAEIKLWREARRGDERITEVVVEQPEPALQTQQSAAAPPVATPPQQVAAIASPPPPAAPLTQAAATPAPSQSTPAPAPPAIAVPALTPQRTTATPPASESVATPPSAPVPAAPRRQAPQIVQSVAPVAVPAGRPIVAAQPPPLTQFIRIDGQRLLTVASYIPGGINMVPSGTRATADQFGEAKLLRQLLASAPPDRREAAGRPLSRHRANRPASAAANAFVAGQQPIPAVQFRARAPQPLILTPPPAATVSSAAQAQPSVTPTNRFARRQPAATVPRLRLRPPPGMSDSPAAPRRVAARSSAPALPADTAAAAMKTGGAQNTERLALNLAGADLRDATGMILGEVLKVRYTVDPEVRGTISAGPSPSLTRDELVPWLRNALQANGADLVITPGGYRVYSLQRASSASGALPALAPPQQAETIFVQGYTAERAGQDATAMQLYTQVAGAYPASGIATMARERLGVLQRRANAPRRTSALPQAVSMAGAYLCTRRGLFPRESKWCGFVRGDADELLQVEVREISYNGLFAIGFSATTCTGGVFIGPLSHGRAVTVPRACMEARW